MRDLEALLITVSAGAGKALVPQLVAERYGAPGFRFVPVDVAAKHSTREPEASASFRSTPCASA